MSFIENTISEHHLIRGEELLDNGAVLEVVEIERKLWSVMIKDEGIIEVEIQNPNQKNQKSTCECKEYGKSKSCAHIAAALLHLRKVEEERLELKKKKEKEQQKQTFNIRTILNAIDDDQLKNYVRSYAQKDRNFGIMFKASFAKSVDLNDNLIKYQSILNNLIKPLTTVKLKSTTSDLRLALKVVDEFNSQLEDNMSVSMFEDAFIIIQATLPKLHYLYSKYTVQKESSAQWIAKFHKHLDHIYDEKLAPRFKETIDDFILELSSKSYYNHLTIALSLFQILEKHKRTKAKENLLTRFSDQSISSIKPSSKVVFGGILIINKMYKSLTISDDAKLASIKYLLKTGSELAAIDYLEYFLENENRNRKMEVALLDAYNALDMDIKFQVLAVDIFVKHGDIRFYKLLKTKVTDADWAKTKTAISLSIEKHKPDTTLLATYFYNEEMISELIDILENELDLRHIMKYDFYLYTNNYIALERIYHKAAANYLDNHIGDIASNFIQEVIVHLSNVRAHKMETSLKKFVSSKYPHRGSFNSFS
ncbi:MAG: hypothetical protein ACJA1A_001201 [Saprospiraceae bacterium]|jgi:hypothetical protein